MYILMRLMMKTTHLELKVSCNQVINRQINKFIKYDITI